MGDSEQPAPTATNNSRDDFSKATKNQLAKQARPNGSALGARSVYRIIEDATVGQGLNQKILSRLMTKTAVTVPPRSDR